MTDFSAGFRIIVWGTIPWQYDRRFFVNRVFEVFVETVVRQFVVSNRKLNLSFSRDTRLNDRNDKGGRYYKMELSENVMRIFKCLVLVFVKTAVRMKIAYHAENDHLVDQLLNVTHLHNMSSSYIDTLPNETKFLYCIFAF